MKIYYSPYFNGHSYIDFESRKKSQGGLLGETLESTEGLLSRLELQCGLSYPDTNEEKRIEEYYDVLEKSIKESDPFFNSIQNDNKDKQRYYVTTELLRWRDTLIMAGWNKKDPLAGKLSVIAAAEANVSADGEITKGSADRWLALLRCNRIKALKDRVAIEVWCPKKIIPSLVQQVVAMMDGDSYYMCEDMLSMDPVQVKDCKVINFNEQYEAYQWLGCRVPEEGQVVVCDDSARLDSVLRSMAKPVVSGDANIGCHHVINDVRSMLDIPKSLIWIDCNGGYRFHYPYDFLSDDEAKALAVPTETEMIEAVNRHYVSQLNKIADVTLVSATYDKSQLLSQHPMVANVLHKKGSSVTVQQEKVAISQKEAGNEVRFERHLKYEVGKNVEVKHARMSASALDALIQLPFNHIVEKELGLYEPYDGTDIVTMKGIVAHKVVELMVADGNGIVLSEIGEYLERALDDKDSIDQSIGRCILRQDENRFELDDLRMTLASSLAALEGIIAVNDLEIVGSEVAIPDDANAKGTVDAKVFGPSVAFIDMVLKKRGSEDYYLFDFKYSTSKRHRDKLAANKSVQFAFYKELFTNFYEGGGKKVAGYGYFLFPMSTLYVPNTEDNGGLSGANIEFVDVDTETVGDTLAAMQKSFEYRKKQFAKGIIEEGEEMTVDSDYKSQAGIFPLNNDRDIKDAPYTPNHIVLKNQIR